MLAWRDVQERFGRKGWGFCTSVLKINMEHLSDNVCSCEFCQMIDVMFGDPLLNAWEKDFVESVASFGWHKDYTPKQKAVIKRLFEKQKKKYAA